MSDYIVQSESLTTVANKIREKTGGTTPLEFPDDFISEINLLEIPGPPKTPTDSILFYSPDVFTVGIYNQTKNWDGAVYYSLDHTTWTEWNGETLTAGLNKGFYVVYLKGSGVSYMVGVQQDTYRFVISGSTIKCVGNLNTLITTDIDTILSDYACFYLFADCINVNFDIVLPHKKMGLRSYAYMFQGCTGIISAPELPATDLNINCYDSMFIDCTTLVNAPSLPVTTLTSSCYQYMFKNCRSLITAPALPATSLELSCYRGMFTGCTSLTTAPALPATTLSNYCYQSMFEGCTSITSPPTLPATTLTTGCYKNMFTGCSALTSVMPLSATVLANECYSSMFAECTSLINLPELPVLTLTTSCYNYMFNKCTKIKMSATQTGDYQTEYRIPTSGTGTTATNALASMFAATGGTFKSTPTINTTYYTSNTVIPAT